MNGDGIQDLLIGAPGNLRRGSIAGRAALWLGRRSGLAPEPDWELVAHVNRTLLGETVARVGDLDGDGLPEFLVTSHDQNTDAKLGRVDIFRGLRRGYAGNEVFPADGVVCISGEDTQERRNLANQQKLESAASTAAESRDAMVEMREESRLRVALVGVLALVGIGTAAWLWFAQRRAREEAAKQERGRIARDLHDGLGSGVNRLQRLTELLNRAGDGSPDAPRLREDFLRTAQELGGVLDRTIWAVKPENDTLENLVTFLASYAPSLLKPHGIQCELEMSAELPAVSLHGEARQHLFLSVNEALQNSLKHADARNVCLRIASRGSEIVIEVTDDGRGIGSSAPRPGGGNGLRNMGERLRELGGTMEVSNRPEGGTRVLLKVPL